MTVSELRRGVEALRIRDLQAALHLDRWLTEVVQRYGPRILEIDLAIADLAGRLCTTQQLPIVDGLLAATALYHDMTLVTRNIRDVERAGVNVFNPFSD